MKELSEILVSVKYKEIIGDDDIQIAALRIDSRKVEKTDVFIALKGVNVDGHDFVDQVIKKGAAVLVLEELPKKQYQGVTIVIVEDTKRALGLLAANYYDNPTEELNVVGITGTNGKTTVATMSYQLFKKLGYKVGLVSTIENIIVEQVVEARLTTPDPIELQSLFRRMVDAGCEYAFMEVSSHAVDQQRIAGIQFAGALFTNLTHDHIDYHGSFKEYLNAKKKFFDLLGKQAFAITNIDDRNGKVMTQNCNAQIFTYGLKTLGDYKANILRSDLMGIEMKIGSTLMYSRLIGEFNVYNLLAVFAIAEKLNQNTDEVLIALSGIEAPEGRFEVISGSQKNIKGIVDYAHTPDALSNVLRTIKSIDKKNKIITVVGCGGDRDKGKRPKMAREALKWSDKVILTSDNPRSEDPNMILEDMMTGVEESEKSRVIVLADRKEAIKVAVMLASEGDVVLVAGKGHEKYQEIKGEKFPFDDKTILKANLL